MAVYGLGVSNLDSQNDENPYLRAANADTFQARGKHFALEDLRATLKKWFGEPHVILDVGAGTGNSTMFLAESFPDARIVAAEPSQTMRDRMPAELYRNERIRVIEDPVQDLKHLGAKSVDVGYVSLAIHYFVNSSMRRAERRSSLADLARVVKDDGVIAVRGSFADRASLKDLQMREHFPKWQIARTAKRNFPSFAQTAKALSAHGFELVENQLVSVGRAQTRAEYAEKCLDRGGSILLREMSDRGYKRGRMKAESWAKQDPEAGPIMTSHNVLVFKRTSEKSQRKARLLPFRR